MKKLFGIGLALHCTAIVGCAFEGDELATVRAEITSVPTGVQCVRLAVRAGGATTATNRDFSVTAGQATTLDLGVLAPGALSVTPSAYSVACASITTGTAATWAGEAAGATVRSGEPTTLTLTLRPSAGTTATVDFVLPARSLSGSERIVYAVMADGTVRRWGYGTAVSNAIETVPGLTGVVQVASRGTSGCALRSNGTAACWGVNANGELGNGTTSATPSATAVSVTMPSGVTFRAIAAAGSRTCAAATGTAALYCWGLSTGAGGTLGNQLTPYVPVLVPTRYGAGAALPGEPFALGVNTLCASSGIDTTCTGANTNAWWGSSSGVSPFRPARSLAFGNDHLCVALANGTVRCAGGNSSGQLGNNSTTSSAVPVTVVGLSGEFTRVASGYGHTCALRSDGKVFCWGAGLSGQLGDRDVSMRTTAVEVYGITQAVDLAAANSTSCALKSDGTVWCWGDGIYGTLGDGNTHSSVTPVRVNL